MKNRPLKSDTTISTIEKDYGVKLKGRKDMKLSNYLKKSGFKSLADLMN